MADALQDALARLDALLDSWRGGYDRVFRAGAASLRSVEACGLFGKAEGIASCGKELSAVVAAIRAAHHLPASAASSAAPPADAPPCSAWLTAGASPDAPALSGDHS